MWRQSERVEQGLYDRLDGGGVERRHGNRESPASPDVKVKSKGREGGNALFWATGRGHTEIVELLKKAGAKE